MGVEENRQIYEAAERAFNERDWARFGELHAASLVVHSPDNPEPLKGREAHVKQAQGLVAAFPDMRVEPVRMFGHGDWVCLEERVTGTHEGPLEGPGGQTIPPTNRRIEFILCSTSKFEGGHITEEHVYFDLLGLSAQLGVLPQP